AQPLTEPRHRLAVKHIRYVSKFGRLLLDRAYDPRMRVAQRGDGEAAEEIQVTVAVGIVEVGALAAHECQRLTSVDVDLVAMRELDDLCVVHVSLIRRLAAAGMPSKREHAPYRCAGTRHAARFRSVTLAPESTTSVPTPERVKISSNTA